VRFLLDTHVLIWLATKPERLPNAILRDLEPERTEIMFSSVNIWEIAIKCGLNRADFSIAPLIILTWARARGFVELAVSSEHSIAVGELPKLHNDPFDRLLIAQSHIENAVLLTADKVVAEYPGPIRLV
jgi:PIN domain nuclease of toxin-antitoxin system